MWWKHGGGTAAEGGEEKLFDCKEKQRVILLENMALLQNYNLWKRRAHVFFHRLICCHKATGMETVNCVFCQNTSQESVQKGRVGSSTEGQITPSEKEAALQTSSSMLCVCVCERVAVSVIQPRTIIMCELW